MTPSTRSGMFDPNPITSTPDSTIAVVDLGVFVLTLVMPAMGFSHPDQQSQRPDPVSQIGVLEGQMHDQEAEPCADGQPQLGTPLLAQRGVERPPAL